ncbi:hypothetical protein E1B28_010351 [Marasmius oreades]|uniref:Uncharacterized protein n=1 Tax=Marasmius oreades TaxID=181124 RepID=A0A9P7RX32_9AGAR|nr:uncharacterized protein E1B28_010351 [Marasmius oreades]KAG7091305.1 hypothetical protein E1B28_010351 [Marasmius oreades]
MSGTEEVFVKEIREAYFNACNFESLMRGIHIAVVISAISKIYAGNKSGPRRHITALLIIILFVLSTIHNAAYWAYVRRAFIAHGETAQSTASALNDYPTWFTGITSVSDANAVLADCIIIWRTWVVWGQSWRVIVLPIISTMLMTAFSIIAIYQTVTSTSFGAVGVDYATALYASTLATTIFCTSAIVYKVLKIGGSSSFRTYRGVVEVLVESSMLYCIATLFALIAYVKSGPASEFASAFWTSVTGIVPTLLVARVASGEARPNDTWNRTTKNTHVGQISFMRESQNSRPTTEGYELHQHTRPDPFAIGYADFEEGERSAISGGGSDGKLPIHPKYETPV